MPKITRVRSSEIAPFEDRECMIIHGVALNEEAVSIAVPLDNLQTFINDLRRKEQAHRSQSDRVQAGGYHSAQSLIANTYDVGVRPTTDGDKVVLSFDFGTVNELSYDIEPSHALALGEELTETAKRVSLASPPKH